GTGLRDAPARRATAGVRYEENGRLRVWRGNGSGHLAAIGPKDDIQFRCHPVLEDELPGGKQVGLSRARSTDVGVAYHVNGDPISSGNDSRNLDRLSRHAASGLLAQVLKR